MGSLKPEAGSPHKLNRARSGLLVVDMQERILPAMARHEHLLRQCLRLCELARELGVPAALSEHCSASLGPTVAQLRRTFPAESIFEKASFSCVGVKGPLHGWARGARDQIIVCGIEAHVCVLQTALDLATAGSRVYVVADAVSARAPESVELAFARARQAGVQVVNFEMVFFEWMAQAATPEFRRLVRLVKE